jgi:hypothetical protein
MYTVYFYSRVAAELFISSEIFVNLFCLFVVYTLYFQHFFRLPFIYFSSNVITLFVISSDFVEYVPPFSKLTFVVSYFVNIHDNF